MGCPKLTYREESHLLKVVYNVVKTSEKGCAGLYRFGFNGMEKDDEVKGVGGHYTTHFRQYDSRLGRWMSLEPKPVAWESYYAAYRNNPIYFIDPRGDIPWSKLLKGFNFDKREGGNAFGMRFHPIHKENTMHYGIDLAAPEGTPIRVAAAGTVERAGLEANGFGYQVWVDHGNGYKTVYAHMHKEPYVKAGDQVYNGQEIGGVGTSGASTGNHLHFEIYKNGTRIDPESVYDLNEYLFGPPDQLTCDEVNQWEMLSSQRNRLEGRLAYNKILGLLKNNKDRVNDRIKKLNKKLDSVNDSLDKLQKINDEINDERNNQK